MEAIRPSIWEGGFDSAVFSFGLFCPSLDSTVVENQSGESRAVEPKPTGILYLSPTLIQVRS
jgi:hypothetical protein